MLSFDCLLLTCVLCNIYTERHLYFFLGCDKSGVDALRCCYSLSADFLILNRLWCVFLEELIHWALFRLHGLICSCPGGGLGSPCNDVDATVCLSAPVTAMAYHYFYMP